MNVVEMVRWFLNCHSYEGLQSGDCCCEVSDLAPCGEITGDCEAGYKIPCPGADSCTADGDCDFHIKPGKRPERSVLRDGFPCVIEPAIKDR